MACTVHQGHRSNDGKRTHLSKHEDNVRWMNISKRDSQSFPTLSRWSFSPVNTPGYLISFPHNASWYKWLASATSSPFSLYRGSPVSPGHMSWSTCTSLLAPAQIIPEERKREREETEREREGGRERGREEKGRERERGGKRQRGIKQITRWQSRSIDSVSFSLLRPLTGFECGWFRASCELEGTFACATLRIDVSCSSASPSSDRHMLFDWPWINVWGYIAEYTKEGDGNWEYVNDNNLEILIQAQRKVKEKERVCVCVRMHLLLWVWLRSLWFRCSPYRVCTTHCQTSEWPSCTACMLHQREDARSL